jgi:hypothetical protein
MKNLFQQYAQHIADLRRQANIKVTDFCNGICDDRTYRRYLSGDLMMTQPKLSALCVKLGISTAEFDRSFNRSDLEETQIVYKLLRSIQTNDFETVKKLLVSLDTKDFNSSRNKEFYEFCIIQYNSQTKKVNPHHAYDLFTSLIDYPTCLNKSIFDLIDILAIQQIAVLEVQWNETKALDVLSDLLFQREKIFITSDERYFLPSIYAYVANVLGRLKRIRESLEISQKGIAYSIEHSDMYVLQHLYYYESLALFTLDSTEASKHAATKSLLTAMIRNDNPFIQRMMTFMKKDFGFDPMELLSTESLNELLKQMKSKE